MRQLQIVIAAITHKLIKKTALADALEMINTLRSTLDTIKSQPGFELKDKQNGYILKTHGSRYCNSSTPTNPQLS